MMGGMLVPVTELDEPIDKSMTAVSTLFDVDPEFVELCKVLYGDAVDPEMIWYEAFGKMEPTGSDMHVMGNLQIDRRRAAQGARRGRRLIAKLSDQKKRGLIAGASAAGAVAGGLGMAEGVRQWRTAARTGAKMTKLGRGLLVAEPIGLTGEIGSTHFLGQDARKKGQPVEKISVGTLADGMERGLRQVHAAATGRLVPKPPQTMGMAGPKLKPQTPLKPQVAKSDVDVVWAGEFSKFDEDKRLVFGWASVVELNGVPVVDRQGDYIHPDDLENASYEYVIKSRVGGDMHTRDGAVPFKVSDLVESMVFTPEKIEKMGLPREAAEKIPTGWWVGFKVHSDKHWDMVKKGHRAGFSIHGRGKRVPTSMDSLVAGYA